ncbi:hypothetical protein GCM10011529_09900 [Polymorphobacter glacialis]|uniref:DUF4010 domain-containing protein n=1 Tax=Sandarakinorhabdus glacialis TaxID=1614636 RepID=A0A917E5P4_9SPHN|nr:DUF4010 domain-containing protein [Polymorphobacter glacialis]GGE05534.1 hypothetical protein GCM10011529_09900 [Polymorphobacter glacialis]
MTLDPALWTSLGTAIAVGLLIGVERGWRQRRIRGGGRVAGLRTFALLGLLGGLAGLMAIVYPLVAAALAIGAVAILVIGYRRAIQPDATTEIAALLTLGLGALAGSGNPVPALAAAAVVTLLLSSRDQLHRWLRGLTETDIHAVARFAIIAAAIWPLLPDRDMGPYNAWNPRDLWLVVVIVCGLSFAGYAASRRFGATSGILATAAIGGLYSSTAVTAALSQQLRGTPEHARALSAGIAVASAVMFVRVAVLAAVLVPFALPRLAIIIAPAAIIALVFVALRWRSARDAPPATNVAVARNPFALLPALGFAVFVAILALIVRWAEIRYGNAGIALTLAITGSMDVDAAIVTMRGLPANSLDPAIAGMILALPVLLNTLVKAGITIVTAGPKLGWPAALPLLASAATMPVAAFLAR